MRCASYSCRLLLRRNFTFVAAASLLLPKRFYTVSKNTLLYSSCASSFKTRSLIPVSSFGSIRSMASQSAPKSVHDFTVKDAKGNDVDLSSFKGKVLLIVNVASQCGLTDSNYTELAQLYQKYKSQDFGIPLQSIWSAGAGSNEEIVEFVCTRFKAEYPIFDKVDVNGEKATPLYKFLKSSKGALFGDNIKWNFSKFLVDKEGNVVDRYAPTTSPLSIEKDVKKLFGGCMNQSC